MRLRPLRDLYSLKDGQRSHRRVRTPVAALRCAPARTRTRNTPPPTPPPHLLRMVRTLGRCPTPRTITENQRRKTLPEKPRANTPGRTGRQRQTKAHTFTITSPPEKIPGTCHTARTTKTASTHPANLISHHPPHSLLLPVTTTRDRERNRDNLPPADHANNTHPSS